jgi:hypothetical protein
VPHFVILGVAEALACGLGVAFLLFGYPMLRARGSPSVPLTRAAQSASGWLLVNWWGP